MLVERFQGRIQIEEKGKMVIIEQVPRGKWDQERVDGLALDRNGTYIHIQLQIIL